MKQDAIFVDITFNIHLDNGHKHIVTKFDLFDLEMLVVIMLLKPGTKFYDYTFSIYWNIV